MDYLDTAGVVARLGGRIKASTLAKWRVRGDGPPFIKVSTRVLYPTIELEKWLASRPLLRSTAEATVRSRRSGR